MNSNSGITVHGSPELLLRTCWEKKITIKGILEKVLELKEIKILEGSIVKIETSVAKLKIAANFRGVIRTFPYFLSWI